MLISCGGNKKTTEDKQEIVVSVDTTSVKKFKFTPILTYSGNVKASKEANLSSTLPGRVEKIHYREGAFVQKDALLVELSDELLIQAQVEYDAIKKDFERLQRLKDKGTVSIIDYDHIKAKFEASAAKVSMMKKNTTIRAPFAGTIVDIFIEEGETFSIMPSLSNDLKLENGVLKLMQLNPIKISIEVNEKELGAITKGLKAAIIFDAYPGEEFEATVHNIHPVLSSSSRTSTVELLLSNNKNRFKPGMYCNVNIKLNETEGLFVPISSIYRQPGTSEDYVYVVNENDEIKRVSIQQGATSGENIQIQGVSEGTHIIANGKNKIVENSRVNFVQK